jgi:hypothetical protein
MADASIPSFVVNTEQLISLTISLSDALLENQGYTYDQAGLSYDQIGIAYGGIYNMNQDISPVFFNDTAAFITPSISAIVDIYTPANGYESIGPGFFMYITSLNHQSQPIFAISGQLMGVLGLTYSSQQRL